MKKLSLVALVLSVFLISCGTKDVKDMKDKATSTVQQAKDAVSDKVDEVKDKVDGAKEDLNAKYADFIKMAKEKLNPMGITDVSVEPFAKGIDIRLVTNKEDFKAADFMNTAKDLADKFRESTGIDAGKIGVYVDYQPNKDTDAKTVFSQEF